MKSFDRRLGRWVDWDLRSTSFLNRAASVGSIVAILRVASRLGNGLLWYVIIAMLFMLPIERGSECAIRMVATGLIGLGIYATLKRCCARVRPYRRLQDVRLCMPPLDEFSFPSGHALHAVAFTLVLAGYFPALALALLPVVLLIVASRVVLGLHYPSDVLAGAAIGAALAQIIRLGFT